LITNDRGDKLASHKVYFSRDDDNGQQFHTLPEVVEYVKPTILMGLSTIRGIFDGAILNRMGELNEPPIVFPLSNPSSQAECTFEEAINWTDGRVVFASGSPFLPRTYRLVRESESQPCPLENLTLTTTAVICTFSRHRARRHTLQGDKHKVTRWYLFRRYPHISPADKVKIYTPAVALSTVINQSELDKGMLYPEIGRIREVSVVVAREVIRQAEAHGLDRENSIHGLGDAE